MLRFDDRGLIPAIVQDAGSGDVLTLAYMDAEALRRTLAGPDVWFYSRSRGELWHKGETSGNYLKVVSVSADCDGDALLVKATPVGPACHTGQRTCFHMEKIDIADTEREPGPAILSELSDVIEDRRRNPKPGSYTTKMLQSGKERIAQKVVEEAGETAIAGVGADGTRLAQEAADLIYHTLLLLSAAQVSPEEVWKTLTERRVSGSQSR
ncbi:MAG: bifunctional phosphoribosyl-AMP cyclohydrolase/phosphoribosyl-ATP diphosphatase HisIE [Chloroflexi bacterium]|nr:bifunctional phosphoribosyl-AMP cyclohydrolase/phosphoribosyl-ATP diphosphatase HisIE [Chloroflexota bacterium]